MLQRCSLRQKDLDILGIMSVQRHSKNFCASRSRRRIIIKLLQLCLFKFQQLALYIIKLRQQISLQLS